MRSKLFNRLQDFMDGVFSPDQADTFAPLLHSPVNSLGTQPSDVPYAIAPSPLSFSAETSTSSLPTASPASIAVSTGGITINLLFDAAAMAAPASFRAGIQQAAAILSSTITDKITVNLTIDYSGGGGGAAAGPAAGYYVPYSTVRADLLNHASPGDATFNALPGASTIQGQLNVAVWNAQAKLWGILGANDTTTIDGNAFFATDINSNLLVGVALHELTHALGRIPYGAAPDIFDLFRFTSPGTRLFVGGATAPAAYFSIDGGNTKLADYGQNSDPSDFLNSGVQGPNDPFNEFYTGSTTQALSTADKEQLDALGFHVGTAPIVTTVIEAFGSTSLVQVGSNYFLDPVGGGTGPELKNGGTLVVAGAYGAWTAIGVEQVGSGYEIAWKSETGQFSVWATDGNGNFVSAPIGLVAATDASLETIETTFHQDLNADGVIGINLPTTTIESYGATKLTQVGYNYYLDPVGGGTGPELKNGGAPVVAGAYGAWTPIGVEQVGSGYEVAWKSAAGQFSVWATDGNGNFVSAPIGLVAATDASLEAIETTFHQDLNGDGAIGVVTTVIEALGSTSLVQVGSNYFLDPVGGGTGPELKNGGVPVVAGAYGAWTPIGVEQVGSGYEVAWKSAAGQFSVWATDGNGNFVSAPIGLVAATDASLEAIETTFHQDLNGDGVIGVVSSTSPAALSVAGPGSTTFDGTTLTLNIPATSSSQIIGFAGDGTLAGSDKIDLNGVSFSSVHSSFDSSSGTLVVTDGSTAVNLQFLGTHSRDSFKFADDGHGGTMIYGSTALAADTANSSAQTGVATVAGPDTFVFGPSFGSVTLTNFSPATDMIQFSKTVFASIDALTAAIHDDSSGNAVITDAAHDTMILQHVTTAQLLANQSAFHFA